MLTRNCRRCFGSSVQIAYSALPPALVNIERTKCYRSTRLCGKGWTGSGLFQLEWSLRLRGFECLRAISLTDSRSQVLLVRPGRSPL